MTDSSNDTLPYELTRSAQADLREIIRYTIRQWGEQQAAKYAKCLEQAFCKIADRCIVSRTFSERYPQVRVTYCERHYIFYLHAAGKKPRVLAVLHERMDLLSRIADRLSSG